MRVENVPCFAELTTLRLGGRALALVYPRSMADLEALPDLLVREGGAPFILGRGSNLLARDGDLPLVLVKYAGEDVLESTPLPGNNWRIRVSSTVPLPRLVAFGTSRGCAALAGLAGIPGNAGGAMAMNAGSYGVEFARLVRSCTVFCPNAGLVRLAAETGFTPGYRHTHFHLDSPWLLILEVELELTGGERDVALRLVGERIHHKAATQPVRAHSAGCVFKNPDPAVTDQSAGKLLDAAGFRGKPHGGVSFSSMHANFLVNNGSGTATQAFELLDMAQTEVARQFGVVLEREVQALA